MLVHVKRVNARGNELNLDYDDVVKNVDLTIAELRENVEKDNEKTLKTCIVKWNKFIFLI